MFQESKFQQSMLGIEARPDSTVFEALDKAYGESARYYHNRNHVTECLKVLDTYRHLAQWPFEIEVAIWFHDSVYDTHKNDNEEMSAEWANRVMSECGVEEAVIIRVVEMILATKTHVAVAPDSQLMLDIDLGILGQPDRVFEGYDQAIRKEYAWVPEEQYRLGRAAILNTFLGRKQIYHTQEFRDAFEIQARSNIKRKIDELVV